MKYEQYLIIKNRSITSDVFEMVLHAPNIAQDCKAGQFVMVYLDRGELLLPRPISVCCKDGENISLVYKILGSGTKHMSTLGTGSLLYLTGPLGNGFSIKNGLNKVALVGGGIGVPPMVMLFENLSGVQVDVFLGFKDESILESYFEGANVHIATETGHKGVKGNVMDLLNRHGQRYDEMYACGPKAMLTALSQYARDKGIPLQVSLEERMACGVGTCMGCVTPVTTTGADNVPVYMKICCEGPVFYSDKLGKC